jgi:hypothetical protein
MVGGIPNHAHDDPNHAHDEETLRLSLEATPVDIIETWISVDARPKRSNERWLNAIARRAGG